MDIDTNSRNVTYLWGSSVKVGVYGGQIFNVILAYIYLTMGPLVL